MVEPPRVGGGGEGGVGVLLEKLPDPGDRGGSEVRFSPQLLCKNLPVDLRQASSLTDFKSKLSCHSFKEYLSCKSHLNLK